MKQTNRSIKKMSLVILVLAAWWSTGCGASKTLVGSGGRDYSSRSNPDTNNGSDGLLAECNEFSLSSHGLKAQLSTHYNSNGTLILDYINMHLDTVPSAILNTSTHYIQIFSWAGETPSALNSVPMYFLQRGTGKVINDGEPVYALSRNIVQSMISKYSLGKDGITLSNFFDQHHIILTNMNITYDALTMVFYDDSTGSTAYASVDALLPAFSADPVKYARTHSSIRLQELHPFYSRRNSGMSEYDYYQMAEEYCQSFFY